jgi:hypothetical protein
MLGNNTKMGDFRFQNFGSSIIVDDNRPNARNGTNSFLYAGSSLQITKIVDDHQFPYFLKSIDIGQSFYNVNDKVEIWYQLINFDNSPSSGHLTITNQFKTFEFNSFIKQIMLGSGDRFNPTGYIAIDNLMYSAAPEPATWATMILGFFMIGAILRHKRQRLTA